MLTSSDLKRMLVPTLDIDLMWHTHQLWNYGYFKDCLESPCHTRIDHDDTVDENKLDDGYEYTPKCIASYSNRNIQFAIVILVLCDAWLLLANSQYY